jgi:hypothetical protein
VSTVEAARPRRRPRAYVPRAAMLGDDRLPGADMRSRQGRQYRKAFEAASAEFRGADSGRIAEVVRLRLLSEAIQAAALAGKADADSAIRAANVAARFARDLHMVTKGKPGGGAEDPRDYLRAIADQEPDLDGEDAEP